jgi:hypothetical protein
MRKAIEVILFIVAILFFWIYCFLSNEGELSPIFYLLSFTFYLLPFIFFSFYKKIIYYSVVISSSLYSLYYSYIILPKQFEHCSGLDLFCGSDFTIVILILGLLTLFVVLFTTQLIQNIIKKREAKKLQHTTNIEPLVK